MEQSKSSSPFFANKALLVIDLQNDFCSQGSLAVPKGEEIIPSVNNCMASLSKKGWMIVASRDTHPADHGSFASQYPGSEPFSLGRLNGLEQVLWPDHCVIGSKGAEFHLTFESYRAHFIVSKGFQVNCDSYSAFWENDKQTHTGLASLLNGHNISEVFVCGLATNFCVLYTALDAVALNYKVSVISDLSRGLESTDGAIAAAIQQMQDANISIVKSSEI